MQNDEHVLNIFYFEIYIIEFENPPWVSQPTSKASANEEVPFKEAWPSN